MLGPRRRRSKDQATSLHLRSRIMRSTEQPSPPKQAGRFRGCPGQRRWRAARVVSSGRGGRSLHVVETLSNQSRAPNDARCEPVPHAQSGFVDSMSSAARPVTSSTRRTAREGFRIVREPPCSRTALRVASNAPRPTVSMNGTAVRSSTRFGPVSTSGDTPSLSRPAVATSISPLTCTTTESPSGSARVVKFGSTLNTYPCALPRTPTPH